MKKQKKAISPVITTILLVLLAIILALIILLWARGFIKEKTMKFDEPIERACEGKIRFDVSIADGNLLLTNQGDVAIYKIGVRMTSGGTKKIIYSTNTNFPAGFSGTITFSDTLSGKIEVIPVLLGEKEKSGNVEEYPCPESSWKVIE